MARQYFSELRPQHRPRVLVCVIATIAACFVSTGDALAQPDDLLKALRFRSIGPAVTGGRIHDIEVDPRDPTVIYLATATGGIWKSRNQGTTWQPIFDAQPVSTFGDLDISITNPNIIWAGTGEQNNRQSTSWGNGVYRSEDEGNTWTHMGLTTTRHIGRMVVHPGDPDIVYVAALGNLWKASEDRGVYRTVDAGRTWERVLFVDTFTGVVDLVMDPFDPQILYAAAYQRMRRTWGFNGGGPGSGIYKSSDGGDTWQLKSAGLPPGHKGRIGLAISTTSPNVLFAMVQHAKSGGTYRSYDSGETWSKVNSLNPRPMYYSHIVVDPVEADRVYVLGTDLYMSEDGGRQFTVLSGRPSYDVGVHADHHALWIDPRDPRHLLLAGDAGLHESWDRGTTFRRLNNLPIGQFYAIGLDNRMPFQIYGGMQDNHSWVGPSQTNRWTGIINDDWRQIGFGDGMYQQVDPFDNRDVYSNGQNGALTRADSETGDILDIRPYPPGDERYRFDWATPSQVSAHTPGTIYFGGNRLFSSYDRGQSWNRTDDLSGAVNRDSLMIMGVIGAEITISKHDGTASYGEITTIAESPLDPSVLWVGTDDGNVQLSIDGGTSWKEVGRNLPDDVLGAYVSRIVASRRSLETAYVALDAHRDGDFRPYVFRTVDGGNSWNSITTGLPLDGTINVVVEHPDQPGLLFLGSEHGLYVSFDSGNYWRRFRANLPTVPVDDIKVHPRDKSLVLGTHGRGVWILDDTTPLAEWNKQVASVSVFLFSIPDIVQRNYWKSTSYRGHGDYAGQNPEAGSPVTYHLSDPVPEVSIKIESSDGSVVRELKGPGETGVIQQVAWDGRHYPPPQRTVPESPAGIERPIPQSPVQGQSLRSVGPFVSPGIYTVTMVAGTAKHTRQVRVSTDPAILIPPGELKSRELYLVELLELYRNALYLERLVTSLLKEMSPASAGAPADEMETRRNLLDGRRKRIRPIVSGLSALQSIFNGNGAKQGSMRGPTEAHIIRRNQLNEKLGEEMQYRNEMEAWKTSEK